MKAHIQKLPKTLITTIISGVMVYSIGRGYIAQDTANLISTLLLAVGVGVNADKLGITKSK